MLANNPAIEKNSSGRQGCDDELHEKHKIKERVGEGYEPYFRNLSAQGFRAPGFRV